MEKAKKRNPKTRIPAKQESISNGDGTAFEAICLRQKPYRKARGSELAKQTWKQTTAGRFSEIQRPEQKKPNRKAFPMQMTGRKAQKPIDKKIPDNRKGRNKARRYSEIRGHEFNIPTKKGVSVGSPLQKQTMPLKIPNGKQNARMHSVTPFGKNPS